jgi:hypothetical protein
MKLPCRRFLQWAADAVSADALDVTACGNGAGSRRTRTDKIVGTFPPLPMRSRRGSGRRHGSTKAGRIGACQSLGYIPMNPPFLKAA